jgi:hypothetical protein
MREIIDEAFVVRLHTPEQMALLLEFFGAQWTGVPVWKHERWDSLTPSEKIAEFERYDQ